MLAIYKGKEYWCKNLSRNKILLLSKKQTDTTFEPCKDIYKKLVNKNECDELEVSCVYAYYQEQKIEIAEVDLDSNKFLLWTSSTHIYSEEFIEIVLEGKRGRDIFVWCDIDKLTKYDMYKAKIVTDVNGITQYTNKLRLPISLEQAIEYIKLDSNY